MKFLRSRAEQLANHLRDCIARGELKEPLPNTRDWSTRLGVGHVTLEQALRILARENLLSIQPRKRVKLTATDVLSAAAARVKVVRWLYVGRQNQNISIWADLFTSISERLREHDIHLVTDRCDPARLRAIAQRGESPNEMLMLANFRERHQRMLAGFRRSVLLIDQPAPGITFPYIWNDAEGAILHAVRELAGRGFSRLCLVMEEHPHVGSFERFFLRACEESKPPVRGELACLPADGPRQQIAARRFVARARGRLGVLAIYPIPATVLISALLERGVKVPEQVEVVAINAMWHSVRVVPPPVYYPFPVEAFARVVVRSALHYFQRGTVPRPKQHIPLRVVRP